MLEKLQFFLKHPKLNLIFDDKWRYNHITSSNFTVKFETTKQEFCEHGVLFEEWIFQMAVYTKQSTFDPKYVKQKCV